MTSYGWGNNLANQLPLQAGEGCSNKYVSQPELLTLAEKSLMCAAGDDHSIILTEGGTVLSFGKGPAIGRDIKISGNVVTGIQHETIASIAAGSVTSFAITTTGRAYQWGLIHR